MSTPCEKCAPSRQSGWSKDLALLAAIVVVAAIAAYPGLLVAPNHWDSCLFVWQGKRLLAGDLPYAAVWDQKFPVLLWLNALAAATGHVYAALYLIETAAISAGAWLICLMARRQLGLAAGAAAGLAYATFASTLAMLDTGNMTETYAALFAILSLYAVIRHAERPRRSWVWPLVSGFGIGAATMLRPPAALIALALLPLVPALRWSGGFRRKPVLAWVGGCLLVPATTAVWAASKGILGLMLRDCVLHNFAYVVETPEQATWDHVGRSLQTMVIHTWVWHLAGLVGLFLVLLTGGKAKAESTVPRPADIEGMAAVWLVAAFASALPGLRFYGHYYYLTLAPLALLSAWAWRELVTGFRSDVWRRMAAAWALSTVAALFIVAQIHWDYAEAGERLKKADPVAEMERLLVSQGRSGDTLAVFGWGIEMDLLARLGWPSPTKHPHAIIYPGLPDGLQRLREWSEEMVRKPPVWLVCNERQDLVQGKMIPILGWDGRAREIAQPVFDDFQSRFAEVARFPVQHHRTMSEPAYYVLYRNRQAPSLTPMP